MSLSVSSLSTNTVVSEKHNSTLSLVLRNVRTRQTIQYIIDDEIKSYNEWKGELFLNILLDGDIKPRRVNVIDYIGVKCSMHSLRFFEKRYPRNGWFEGQNWDTLRSYIYLSAHISGYPLSCNVKYGSKKNLLQFFLSGRVH